MLKNCLNYDLLRNYMEKYSELIKTPVNTPVITITQDAILSKQTWVRFAMFQIHMDPDIV